MQSSFKSLVSYRSDFELDPATIVVAILHLLTTSSCFNLPFSLFRFVFVLTPLCAVSVDFIFYSDRVFAAVFHYRRGLPLSVFSSANLRGLFGLIRDLLVITPPPSPIPYSIQSHLPCSRVHLSSRCPFCLISSLPSHYETQRILNAHFIFPLHLMD